MAVVNGVSAGTARGFQAGTSNADARRVSAATGFAQQHISPELLLGTLLCDDCCVQHDFAARAWQHALRGGDGWALAGAKELAQQCDTPNKQQTDGGINSIVPATRTKKWPHRLVMLLS